MLQMPLADKRDDPNGKHMGACNTCMVFVQPFLFLFRSNFASQYCQSRIKFRTTRPPCQDRQRNRAKEILDCYREWPWTQLVNTLCWAGKTWDTSSKRTSFGNGEGKGWQSTRAVFQRRGMREFDGMCFTPRASITPNEVESRQ